MRLEKTLTIGGNDYPLVSEDVVLNLNGSSNANFIVFADHEPTGVVIFDFSYTTENPQRFFIGYIETATRKSADHYVLVCRELSTALQLHCPVSLRSCTAKDVLNVISAKTGLRFQLGESPYSTSIQPRFNSVGNGYDVLSNMARIFSIADFVWFQQMDGSIYIGSWQDSFWADKPIELDQGYFKQQQGNHSATIPAVSALRPGVLLNEARVKQVRLIKNRMLIQWSS